MARLTIVQHQDDAPPGLLSGWAADAGHVITVVRPDRGAALPAHDAQDAAIVLGSDDYAIPGSTDWMDRELDWLRDLAKNDVPILGICFGAQALAVALGGARRRAPLPEVAWIRVDTIDPERIPEGPWFAWHSDVVDPPPGASVLATNGFSVQAYAFGPHLGVQFHPETTPEIIDGWSGTGGRDLARLGLDREGLATQSNEQAAAAASAATRLFDGFLASALPHAAPTSPP